MDEFWKTNLGPWKPFWDLQKEYWDRIFGEAEQEGLPPLGGPFQPLDSWSRQWSNFISQVMGDQFGRLGTGIGPETFGKMFTSADTTMKFLSFWSDMYRNLWERVPGMKTGKWEPEKFREAFSEWEERYRELVGRVFAEGLPGSLTWLADAYKGMLSGAPTEILSKFLEPWTEFTRDYALRMTDPTRWTAEEIAKSYEQWRDAYEKTFASALRTPGLGYYRESYEKMVESLDSWVEFNMSLAEFYAIIYRTGTEAMEKLQEKIAGLQAEENPPESLMQLYDIWWKTNEEAYIDIFRSDEFSRMLGHLVDRGMDFRRAYQGFLEELWKDLPFPNRSEMDHLYKTVHQLKRDVKRLSAELERLKKQKQGVVPDAR